MLKRILIFFGIVVVLGLLSIFYPYLTGEKTIKPIEYERETIFVERVIDGDTLVDSNGTVYRLLGINTPEKNQAYYNEAKDFLMEIEDKFVLVLRDFEDEGKYNRKLRYVFYNNRFLNIEILEKGFGTCFMIGDLKYENKLKNAERFSSENGIGLWEKSTDKCSGCIKLTELNPVDEFFILRNRCDFNCDLNGWIVKDNANHFFKLKKIMAGENEKYDSKGKIWNNDGDRFFMRDAKGKLVIFYEYKSVR